MHIVERFEGRTPNEIKLQESDFEELRDKNLELTKESLRESVTEDDKIIRLVRLIEEYDKSFDQITKRFRSLYSLYWPEREHLIRDHERFLDEVLKEGERPSNSMGGKFLQDDLQVIEELARQAKMLKEQRSKLQRHLEKKMKDNFPNLSFVAGPMLGAQLLSLAGGLKRLSRMPSGTVQLLGAEAALFLHIRRGTRPPKHGIIFNHEILQRSPQRLHGKVAVALANTISIASKIDYFKGDFQAEALLKKVERAAK